jgi:hypothetical protein
MYRQTPSFSQTLLWSCLLASAAAVATAQTSPTTLMQIDGNAANDNLTCSYGTPCDYWNLLNGTRVAGDHGSAGHSKVRTFIDGTASTDASRAEVPRIRVTSRPGNGAALLPPTKTP